MVIFIAVYVSNIRVIRTIKGKRIRGVEVLVKVRHRVVYLAIKYLTPTVFERLRELERSGVKSINFFFNVITNTPRPSIIFMKKHFKHKRPLGVEIGVFKGINSKSILKVLRPQRLFLIDPYLEYHECHTGQLGMDRIFESVKKMFRKDKRVKILRTTSLDASFSFSEDSLDFVYIDGDHEYNAVLQDLRVWYPKVVEGGVLGGHDILSNNGVHEALKEFCQKEVVQFHIDMPDWYIVKKGIITCKNCGYYNKEVNECIYENIRLDNNLKICVCFMPIMSYNERKKRD